MVVEPVYTKSDDLYPLLMVAGAGDAATRDAPPVVVDPMTWTTPAPPRRPWAERWPEYLSTCWMTLIFLGISFLVFYAVGMVVVYRHEAFVLVKYNDTKPASEVFYHSIIPRGGAFPLINYAEYLSHMATTYPNLRFNVHFMIDDSRPTNVRFIEKLYPYSAANDEYNLYNRREVRCFHKKYPNVNITVMLLSEYMEMTPLKYKWKNIPIQSIPFYARIFSVWSNAGIGLDIAAQNQDYHLSSSQRSDRKIKAILKQHNDGITPEKYVEIALGVDEEYEYLTYIVETVQKFFIESVFNKSSKIPTKNNTDSLMEPSISLGSKSLIRSHRSKRDILVANQDNSADNASSTPAHVDIILANSTVVNTTGGSDSQNMYQIAVNEPNLNATPLKMVESKLDEDESVNISNENSNANINVRKNQAMGFKGSEKNKSDLPQIVFFYDISMNSEPMPFDNHLSSPKNASSPLNVVILETGGSFVASTSRFHPFLVTIFTAACKRVSAKIAIDNAFLTRCPGTFRDEKYCNSVFVL